MNAQNPEDDTFNTAAVKRKKKTRGITHWKFVLLIILFVFGLYGTMLMWFTSVYYDNIFQNLLTLENGKLLYKLWKNPPLTPLLCVHVFNYTNAQEYFSEENKSSKKIKLKVKEAGPYCFREEIEKVNIVFLNNGSKVIYNERKTHIFVPEASVGSLNDTVTVPNVQIIAVYQSVGDFFQLLKFTGDAMLRMAGAKVITEMKVNDYLFGFEDDIFSTIYPMVQLVDGHVPKRFGVLMKRTGLSKDEIMTTTGDDGQYDQMGQVLEMNNDTNLNAWPSNICDSIAGSDGSIFPRSLIQSHQDVHFLNKEACIKLPLQFDSVVDIGWNIKANRYKLRSDTFDYSLSENTCFCNMSNSCRYNGILDFSSCPDAHSAPLLLSRPHLLGSNANFNDNNEEIIEGLEPNITKHDFKFDIYPPLGVTVRIFLGLQLNILVKNPMNNTNLNPLEERTVLPLAWIEMISSEVPKNLFLLLFLLTYVAKWLEVLVKWLFLISTLLMAFVLFKIFFVRFSVKQKFILVSKKRNFIHNTTETMYIPS